MIKLVAFDLDGTIGDTLPLCLHAFKEAVSPYFDGELSEEDIIRTFGLNEEGMIGEIIDKEHRKKALCDFYMQYQKFHPMCPSPFKGMRELILDLKKRDILLALITGKGEMSCQITLKQFEMGNYFDFIQTGSSERNIKSEALAILQYKYDLQPDQLVYIGDAVSDIISCNEARVQCLSACWATSADSMQLQQYNKGFVFSTIESLREYLFQKLKK